MQIPLPFKDLAPLCRNRIFFAPPIDPAHEASVRKGRILMILRTLDQCVQCCNVHI
jgi:hypothetical protein